MIERCHRSAGNPQYHGTAPRPVFAAFSYWPDTVSITDAFWKKNIADRNFKQSVDYKYGPLTTKRRSLAKQERKRLRASGEIVSAYVAYPARLMVKKSKRQGARYVLHKDFSREKVTLGKRD